MKKCRVPSMDTARLYLRMWNKKDAAALYEYARNPNVGPVAGWKPHSSQAESRTIITECFMRNMVWAIVDRSTGRPIGSIGLSEDKMRPGINSRELGYSLSEEHWGRGLMTEAAERVIKYGFEELQLDVISINTMDDNVRSQRVIEKCCFRYEGLLRSAYKVYDGSIRSIRCYSMLRTEYNQIRKGCKVNGKEGENEA